MEKEPEDLQVHIVSPRSKSKSARWLVLIAVILIAAGVYFFLGKSGGKIPAIPALNPFAKPQPSSSVTAQVNIAATGFIPQTLLVKKGTTVTWKNTDSRPHCPTSDPHPLHTLLPSLTCPAPLKPNTTYSLIFNTSGTFTYHDELNPLKLKGTIIVQ